MCEYILLLQRIPSSWTYFNTGKMINSSKPSWKGKNTNLTVQEIQESLYDNDYSNFAVELSPFQRYFSLTFGYCMKLSWKKASNSSDIIWDVKKSLFLIVDPYKDNKLRIFEMDNARISFGPTFDEYFDFSSYELIFTEQDARNSSLL